MTTVSLRFKDSEKKALEAICEEMGMNLPTLFSIYAKVVLRERRIPFVIEAPDDVFYSKSNQAQLEKAVAQVNSGKLIEKSIDELESLAR